MKFTFLLFLSNVIRLTAAQDASDDGREQRYGWSITNGDGHLPRLVWESFVDHYVAAGMMLGVAAVSLSYPVFHRIYLAKSSTYREALSQEQQLVVVQHSIEAFFLTLMFAPYTYIISSVFFESQPLEELSNKFTVVASSGFTIIILYMIEIASRFRNLRPLVVAHHLCAYLNAIFPVFFLSTANAKAAAVFTYFITYEAVVFVGLVLYRLAPTHRATRPTILAGMLIFGLSRPMQFILMIGSFIATWKDLVLWHAVFQILLTIAFTTLQFYSLTIHYALYKKCYGAKNGAGKKPLGLSPSSDNTDGEDDESDVENGNNTDCQLRMAEEITV